MTRRRKALIVALLSTSAFVFFVGALELIAGWMGHRGPPGLAVLLPWVAHPERGIAYKPNLRFRYLATTGWVEGTTDGDGFRPVVCARDRADSPIVVCLGDSTTFGCESPDDATWPEAAAKALTEKGAPCRALNRGIRSYGTIPCLATLRETLRDESKARRVRAVVYLFCANDPSENFQVGFPRLDAAHFAEGVPPSAIKILPPGAVASDGSGAPAAGARDGWGERRLSPSFLARVREKSALLAAIRYARRGTSAASHKTEAVKFAQMFAEAYESFLSQPHLQKGMAYALRELAAECTSRKVPLFVASWVVPIWDGDPAAGREFLELTGWPPEQLRAQAASYQAGCDLLKRLTEEAGATFVELRGCLSGMSFLEYAASSHDWHYSAAANARIGSAIAAKVFAGARLLGD